MTSETSKVANGHQTERNQCRGRCGGTGALAPWERRCAACWKAAGWVLKTLDTRLSRDSVSQFLRVPTRSEAISVSHQEKWIDKVWNNHTMKRYLATKRNESQTRSITGTPSEQDAEREKSDPRPTCCVAPPPWGEPSREACGGRGPLPTSSTALARAAGTARRPSECPTPLRPQAAGGP